MEELTRHGRTAAGAPISRRGLIRSAGAAGLVAAIGSRAAFAAGPESSLKVGFVSPAHRRPRRLRRDRRLYPRARAQGARAGTEGRRQDLCGPDPRSRHAVRSAASRPARQDADQLRQDRHDAVRLDAGDDQSGRRRLRGRGGALPLDRHALGSLVFRARRQARRAFAVQVDLSFRFRRRRVLQDLRFAVGPLADQQEGWRALPERRRRQRHPREPRARARQGRLHHRRPRSRTRTERPTFRPRSPSSRRRSARSSTPSRFRRISPRSGGRPPSRATRRWSRSPRLPRQASFRARSRRSAISASISRAPPTGTRPSLTSPRSPGSAARILRRATRRPPASNGRSSSARRSRVFDAGFDALKASGDPTDKAAVAKAISTLKTTTIAGKVDFTSGPVPNVSPGPIIGTQWVKAPPGSKFKLDYVVTENATDPNVPVSAKLVPFNS